MRALILFNTLRLDHRHNTGLQHFFLLLHKLVTSDVTCSVVLASQEERSTHYVAEWLVKIDQIRKTYNFDMELETSPSALISNRIILDCDDTCYLYCYT